MGNARKVTLWYVSHIFRKRTFGHVRPAKIQLRLRTRAVWSESSLGVFLIAKDAKFLHVDNEDSNQIARMRKLFLVFIVRTCQKVRFSYGAGHMQTEHARIRLRRSQPSLFADIYFSIYWFSTRKTKSLISLHTAQADLGLRFPHLDLIWYKCPFLV